MIKPIFSKIIAFLFLVITVAVIVAMFPKNSYNDPDTFWHIELGTYMLDHGTVLHHAIHTFYNDKLPYVPHEFGFQIIISLLYQAFGWSGTYLLTSACMLLLILGLYRLTVVSRKEIGLDEHHSVLFLFVLAVSCFIYYNYFTTRPQMISSFLIVWFFVFLREFQMRPRVRYTLLMAVISLAIANIHAGVWLVIAVFTGMAIAETLFLRKWTKLSIVTYVLIFAAGLFNIGGLQNLLYIFTVTQNNFNLSINEWQPVYFAKPTDPRTILLLFFALILPVSLHGKIFRYMFMLGILFLGISSYKQNLFMWLFIPYFAATCIDIVPFSKAMNIRFKTSWIVIGLLIGITINIGSVFISPPTVNAVKYPVDEMDYILRQTPVEIRPKVLAKYGDSGYVMFRGGDILCDGRQDPFITDESKGVFGWTAFERSIKGFSVNLPDVVRYDKPDYVIVTTNTASRLFADWTREFGKPVYKGRYGSVFHTNNKW